MDDPPDPQQLGAIARSVALSAAELVRAEIENELGRRPVSTKTSLTDMVTAIDRASEALIVRELSALRPHDAIVGEEGAAIAGSSGVTWVVDPIDGTTNFVYGLAGYAVSIGVRIGDQTVAGAVADVARGELFSAVAGAGATRNGAPIRVRAAPELSSALVGTGFSYDPERRRRQAVVLATVLPAVRDIRRMGAASTDLCAVACGRLDGYYERGLAPWDYAAGELIAREAGARTGNLDGGPPGAEFTLACSPALFDRLAALLRTAGAGEA